LDRFSIRSQRIRLDREVEAPNIRVAATRLAITCRRGAFRTGKVGNHVNKLLPRYETKSSCLCRSPPRALTALACPGDVKVSVKDNVMCEAKAI
jgi:hypothetical protein